jgi:hypothetical protein
VYATFWTRRIFRTGEPITGRVIRDAVIPHPANRVGSYPFECLWDLYLTTRSPYPARTPPEPCQFLNSLGTRAGLGCFLYDLEEEAMRKLAFVFAAIAVAALTGANAEELGVRVGGDRDMYRDRDFRAARAEFAYGEHDRSLHRGRAGAQGRKVGWRGRGCPPGLWKQGRC